MRKTTCINKNWLFYKDARSIAQLASRRGKRVDLPHTWNNLDGQDGGDDYFRGACWYVKRLGKPDTRGKLYLEFEGANSVAEVYLNGEFLCRHAGGFSAFRARIDDRLRGGDLLAVKVDNSHDDGVYPQYADFTFFGGIYRDVKLISVSDTHFELDDFGGIGATVVPRLLQDTAEVEVRVSVVNLLDAHIHAVVADRDGNAVCSFCGVQTEFCLNIDRPRLWQGVADPYLYELRLNLVKNGEICDNLVIPFGVRSFKIDAAKGFLLNGESYPLRGVSRHQDRLNKGWAISRKDHERDMRLIRQLGANAIRLAHYQHDEYFYRLCDRCGMVVWAEIPYISIHSDKASDNAKSQLTELIVQNRNHTCIAVWGLSNEITLNGESEEILKLHNELNDLAHSLDNSRKTTVAQLTTLPESSPMNRVADVISYNHYFGWYGGDASYYAEWIDKFHGDYPDIALGISEYGAEAVLRWHSDNPQMGDYSEEYQCAYHKTLLDTFASRPFVWASFVWNMFDFAADRRDEGGVKGRNNKGLVTYDRKTRKDSYYLYQAYWTQTPVLHLASKRFRKRCGDSARICVYSNQTRVSLFVNGKLLRAQTGSKVFEFDVPLANKFTVVKATSGGLSDRIVIERVKKNFDGYILASGSNSVTNWFDRDGNELKLTFDPAFYSVRDKINEIMKDPRGRVLMEEFMSDMTAKLEKDGMKIPQAMAKMTGGFSIERISKLISEKVPPETVCEINGKLQLIPKNSEKR